MEKVPDTVAPGGWAAHALGSGREGAKVVSGDILDERVRHSPRSRDAARYVHLD